jgi:hypothetical protein
MSSTRESPWSVSGPETLAEILAETLAEILAETLTETLREPLAETLAGTLTGTRMRLCSTGCRHGARVPRTDRDGDIAVLIDHDSLAVARRSATPVPAENGR